MIPKQIHYIWLGGKTKSKITQMCILSWRTALPDYDIVEWNETNLPMDQLCHENRFLMECRKRHLWAFMADYLRVYILYQYGGIYLDTDVQLLQSLDQFTSKQAFIGCECYDYYCTAVMGFEPQSNLLKQMLDFYNEPIWHTTIYTIPEILTHLLTTHDDLKQNLSIYPMEYFSPLKYDKAFDLSLISENTYAVHWFDGSWVNNFQIKWFLQTKHITNPLMSIWSHSLKLASYFYHMIIN